MNEWIFRGFAGLALVAAGLFALSASTSAPTMAGSGTGATASQAAADGPQAVAIFAGGCFWCVESDFDRIDGVISTTSGYIGGRTDNPTYKQVTYEDIGHYEAVKVVYDPSKVTYSKLVDYFWTTIDPLDAGGQFCDRGHSYKTAIFSTTDEQLQVAQASKRELQASKRLGEAPIATPVLAAPTFWDGEDYHQDYYLKNPVRYKVYRYGCGRDARIRELWGTEAHGGKPHS